MEIRLMISLNDSDELTRVVAYEGDAINLIDTETGEACHIIIKPGALPMSAPVFNLIDGARLNEN